MKDSKATIEDVVKGIESRRGCRVLFVVESGSRAWGFASPDSDYDVRGVYVKPLDWYLQLREGMSDTIVELLPDDIDVSLWDLRKALLQMTKSNASFLEWLGSPIIYRDDGLIGQLNALKYGCFNSVHVAYHYASMFRKAMEAQDPDGAIRIKKLCYALRASLCLKYVMAFEEMPPTLFADVLEKVSITSDERDAIRKVLERKEYALESDTIVPDARLGSLLIDRYDSIASHLWCKDRAATEAYSRLELIFRNCVKGAI